MDARRRVAGPDETCRRAYLRTEPAYRHRLRAGWTNSIREEDVGFVVTRALVLWCDLR